jgi:hypothetical protein
MRKPAPRQLDALPGRCPDDRETNRRHERHSQESAIFCNRRVCAHKFAILSSLVAEVNAFICKFGISVVR